MGPPGFGREDCCDPWCERCPAAVLQEREGIGDVYSLVCNKTLAETSFFWDDFAEHLQTSGPYICRQSLTQIIIRFASHEEISTFENHEDAYKCESSMSLVPYLNHHGDTASHDS